MNTTPAVSFSATLGRFLSIAAAIVLGLALHTTVAADKTPLPVTVTFEKATGDDGPYVMTVTNTSAEALAVQVTVHQSVQAHNQPKNVEHPEETLAAGKSTTVKGLAALDKVKISAKGHSALEVVVPGKTAVAADKTPVPVTVAFEKTTGDGGPYVMTVTNSSAEALAVQVTVHQSVQAHNQPKNVEHPEETLAAGKSTKVKGLAALDKVKISAKGHSALEIVVPGKE